MTRAWFDGQMARLTALKGSAADIDSHWEALSDLPGDVFAAAVGHALRTREWFPVPAELRADADHVAVRVRVAVPDEARDVPLEQPFTITVPAAGKVVSVTREWKYYDERCNDTGWASWWCGERPAGRQPWMLDGRCERRGEHGGHEWVGRCMCWDSNPALVRKREAQRKYAEEPQKVKR